MLEHGQILFFREPPFDFPAADQKFLLEQEWSELRMHKNVSYRPSEDSLRGVSGDRETISRLQSIMRNYSAQVTQFLGKFLTPYAGKWNQDFASFRPLEEEGRDLPLHKRNDLLHVDAFPSRPTRGARILRVFTNLNPKKPRVWRTTEGFEVLARRYAGGAGLQDIAEDNSFLEPHGAGFWFQAGFRCDRTNALRYVHASLPRFSEGKHGISEGLPEDSVGISTASDLAGFHRLRGARSNVRPVRHRADIFDSTESAGCAGGCAVSHPWEHCRPRADFLIRLPQFHR